MSDSSPSKNFWTAVGALAAVAGVIIAYMTLRQGRTEPADDRSPDAADSATAADSGDGTWYEADSYTVRLPTTFQGDDCWDRHYDLDDGGTSEPFHGDSDAAEWADLIWYSCGAGQTGYLYSPAGASGLTAAGELLTPDLCNAASGGDDSLAMPLDPDALPSEHGCLVTTSGALAGVSVTALDWVGEGVEAELDVIVWRRD